MITGIISEIIDFRITNEDGIFIEPEMQVMMFGEKLIIMVMIEYGFKILVGLI